MAGPEMRNPLRGGAGRVEGSGEQPTHGFYSTRTTGAGPVQKTIMLVGDEWWARRREGVLREALKVLTGDEREAVLTVLRRVRRAA